MPRDVKRNALQHGTDHDQDEPDEDLRKEAHLSMNQSASNSITGDPANMLTLTSYLNLNASAVMASVLECMTLQQCTYHIPQSDGKDPHLKDFVQDVTNGAVFVTDAAEPGFIKAVLAKLKGVSRESVRDKQFSIVKELIAHLKKRFAPTKKYQWYFKSTVNLRMKQSETVSDYNDRVQGLLSGARHAVEEKYTGTYGHTNETVIMMKPVVDCALDAFIRGLSDDISIFVDTRNFKNLSKAFKHALNAEERHKYSEKNNMASSYHIARPRERVPECPRSPSPSSKQMDDSGKYAKSERPSSTENSTAPATLRLGHNVIPDRVYAPLAYNKFRSHCPPLQSNYPLHYPYPVHHYAPSYPYPPQYPYPPYHAMAPYPPISPYHPFYAVRIVSSRFLMRVPWKFLSFSVGKVLTRELTEIKDMIWLS